jgi:hypothetical protein
VTPEDRLKAYRQSLVDQGIHPLDTTPAQEAELQRLVAAVWEEGR